MFENFEVQIQQEFGLLTYSVYIYRKRPDGTIDILKSDGATVENKNQESAEPLTPTMRMTKETMQAFFQALQDKGFVSEEESATKGKLERTDNHLADMRKLLKLK